MIHEIHFPGLMQEMLDWSEDYNKKYFRQKIIRVYIKCLKANKVNLAVKIAEKHRKALTETLRSDMAIATQYSIFAARVTNSNPEQ